MGGGAHFMAYSLLLSLGASLARSNEAWSGIGSGAAPLSHAAASLRATQMRCNRLAYLELPNYGLGSDLQIWAGKLCLAASHNISLVAVPAGELSCLSGCQNFSFSAARASCRDGRDSQSRQLCRSGSSARASPWVWHDLNLCRPAMPPLSCSFGEEVNLCAAHRPPGAAVHLAGDLPPSPRGASVPAPH